MHVAISIPGAGDLIMSDILVLQHGSCETLGAIESALGEAGLGFRYLRSYSNEPGPSSLGSAAGLIVMGGPMGV